MKASKLSIILIAIIIVAFFVYRAKTTIVFNNESRTEIDSPSNYTIKYIYNLPEILNEVSGIVWLRNNTFACVQDEDGIIFIYNTDENAIVNKIQFAGPGDYEGISIDNEDAYVLRSDGLIYEIKNYESKSRIISKLKTPFTQSNNIESLTFDKQNNRLLIAPKDNDLGVKQFKSIYQIPMKTKLMVNLPLLEIDLKSEELIDFKHKKIQKTLRPSAIAIHPLTQNIYVLEAKNPKLLIINTKGDILKVYPLNKQEFAQPEGITFSNDGRLFISNEANNYSANILEVKFK